MCDSTAAVLLCFRLLTREVKLCFAPAWGEPFLTRFHSMNLLKRVCATFPEHPASVRETYLQHARHSIQFGIGVDPGSLAVCLHALIPAPCTSTSSRIIVRLYDRMILNRTPLKSRAQSSRACESYLT